MAVSAGDLNRRVILRVPSTLRNDEGSKTTTFTSLDPISAKIEQTNQQRALEVAPVLLNTDKVTIRYWSTTAAITKDWMVNYDDKDHVIHAIDFDGKKFITLIVKANG